MAAFSAAIFAAAAAANFLANPSQPLHTKRPKDLCPVIELRRNNTKSWRISLSLCQPIGLVEYY